MNIKIKSIQHLQKVGKQSGKEFTSCKITSLGRDGKDVFISGFGSDVTKTWNAGDTVDIDITQTPSGYWNFTMNENSKPSPNPLFAMFGDVNKKLDEILNIIKPVRPQNPSPLLPLDNTVKDEDIPDFLRV